MANCRRPSPHGPMPGRLGSLVPGIQLAGANEHALQSYTDAGDLDPEEAAEIYTFELPPGEAGASGET